MGWGPISIGIELTNKRKIVKFVGKWGKCIEKRNSYLKYFDKIKCYADRPYLVFFRTVFTVTYLVKKWVGRLGFFSTQTTDMHILAIIMLHQHKFCVYKGKRKLKFQLLVNTLYYTFCALFVFILLCKYIFRKCGKKSLQSEFFKRGLVVSQ